MPKPKPAGDENVASATPPAATSERQPATAVAPTPTYPLLPPGAPPSTTAVAPTPTTPSPPPGLLPSTMLADAGVQQIPPRQRNEAAWEEQTTSKKRSASVGPSARIREPEGPKAKVASAKPRPPRPPRIDFAFQAHEVRPPYDLDTDRELEFREARNQSIKAQLLEGKTVAYHQSGWSLYPRASKNDLCCYVPVRFDESVDEGDIVFCEVQPEGHFYAHLVQTKQWAVGLRRWIYGISDLKGRRNGWCEIKHIYGKLHG